METIKLNKRGQIGQLPGFFQIMMLVVIFAGLTFIVAEKFMVTSYNPTTVSVVNETTTVMNESGYTLTANTYRDCGSVIVDYVVNGTGSDNASNRITSGNWTLTECTIATNADTSAEFNGTGTSWNITYSYIWSADTVASNAVNETTTSLYDYGIGFLGIVILVVMVYLIISIVSGRKSGAK